jgi:SNF2 family DNA or RNA helicase
MSTDQDRETQGVPGPNTASPERANGVDRIQETGGGADEFPETHTFTAEINAFSSGSSRELFTVPDSSAQLEGFASPEWVPANYQVRGVDWLGGRIGAALFLPPGFGKTSIVLAAKLRVDTYKVARHDTSARMLVIAPLTAAVTTWMAEPKKWRQFVGMKVALARGPDRESILMDDSNDVVVINYDALEWAAPRLARGHNFSILACDELTRLKHISSKRFKLIKPLLPSFIFRWGMTGTPAANGLLDLFGQVMILDLGERLGRYITRFRSQYFYQKPWDQYRYYISDESATRLVDKIKDICMYMDPGEFLNLPPLLDVIRPIEIEPKVRKLYKELEDEFIIALEMGVVTAANAGVLTSKLRQFTGGAVYHPGTNRLWSLVHSAKIEGLDTLVEELAGEPLMVAYQFEHEFERLIKAYPEALFIKGGMTKNQLQDTVEKWNTGSHPLLLVQPSAAALGLNLQFGGHNLAWFSLTYNLEEYIQLIARLLRKGQTKPVMNYILTVEKTIDVIVAKVLVEKDLTQNKVFAALQQLKV